MNEQALGPTARLALDTIRQKPVKGIPTWLIHVMEHGMIDRLAGVPDGTYRREPKPSDEGKVGERHTHTIRSEQHSLEPPPSRRLAAKITSTTGVYL